MRPYDLSCPYCGMAWQVTNGFEVNRILDQHDDLCETPRVTA